MLILHQLSHQLIVLFNALIRVALPWDHLAVRAHLPGLLLLSIRAAGSLEASRLSRLALRGLACDPLRHVRLRRELSCRLLIHVLKVVRLAVVVSGEMRRS